MPVMSAYDREREISFASFGFKRPMMGRGKSAFASFGFKSNGSECAKDKSLVSRSTAAIVLIDCAYI